MSWEELWTEWDSVASRWVVAGYIAGVVMFAVLGVISAGRSTDPIYEARSGRSPVLEGIVALILSVIWPIAIGFVLLMGIGYKLSEPERIRVRKEKDEIFKKLVAASGKIDQWLREMLSDADGIAKKAEETAVPAAKPDESAWREVAIIAQPGSSKSRTWAGPLNPSRSSYRASPPTA